MRNVSDTSYRENQNTFSENQPVYEICEQYGRTRQATDDDKYGLCTLRATDIHSEYVMYIAFPRHKWSHKRASLLCYIYFACLN
jgi:hypothetical protein